MVGLSGRGVVAGRQCRARTWWGVAVLWAGMLVSGAGQGRPPKAAAAESPQIRFFDERGRELEPPWGHASVARGATLVPSGIPSRLEDIVDAKDGLRFVLISTTSEAHAVELSVLDEGGTATDYRGGVVLRESRCPASVPRGLFCRVSPRVRISPDRMDARLPLPDTMSLVGKLGGRLRIALRGHPVASIAIGGPREGRVAPFGRLRARLRIRLVVGTERGRAILGQNDAATLSR